MLCSGYLIIIHYLKTVKFQSLKFAHEINKSTLNSMKKIQNDILMSFLNYKVVYGLFTKHARLLTLLCQEPVDPCIFLTYWRYPLNTEQTKPCYRVHHFIVPLFPQIQLSLSKFLRSDDFFPLHLIFVVFIVTIHVSDWLWIYHLQVRLLRWFSSAWKGFLWTLFRIFLSIISRRCFAYFAVDHLFTRFSSVCKGILFTHFQCSI